MRSLIFEVHEDQLLTIRKSFLTPGFLFAPEVWVSSSRRHNGWYFVLEHLRHHQEPIGPFLGELGAEMAAEAHWAMAERAAG